MMKKEKKFFNKKSVSEMLSYVILISIAITMAIAVFAWLKIIANVKPVEACEEGTSVIINNYVCGNNILNLTIKNNGRFDISGFVLEVGDNSNRARTTRLLPLYTEQTSNEGFLIFRPALNPGKEKEAIFSDKEKRPNGEIREIDFQNIANIKLQPFIIHESGTKIVCEESIIRQNLENCRLK